ncbi:hypothetical protein LAZ67_1007717 [Cordylochernes scorpioides]|uniref:RNase H type-1 domain-containing protein n=1 Tax=Cordylochernes scorpioides TaxID=51811 RepID=A0ABY6K2G8_9ARAC|nr:hypothetical protein LAZ67_1007717 [Cordylochernes scorpioides]
MFQSLMKLILEEGATCNELAMRSQENYPKDVDDLRNGLLVLLTGCTKQNDHIYGGNEPSKQQANRAATQVRRLSELLKALGLQIIEENSSLFDNYTDGSQLETGLSGSGIAIYKDNILEKISLSHPRHLSVYKSELSAIDTALKDININSPSKIIIYSDSRAAIYTLQSCFSSQEPLLKSIAKSLTLEFLADSLAKAGALGLPEARESTTQLDKRDLLRTIKTQCLQEWKSDAAHDWYRAGGTSTGSVLPREQHSLISRLKSGHLRTMTFQNGCRVFPLCTKCNSQPATPRHIIDCIDSSIDELYSSPADTIKNLKLYKLDTLVTRTGGKGSSDLAVEVSSQGWRKLGEVRETAPYCSEKQGWSPVEEAGVSGSLELDGSRRIVENNKDYLRNLQNGCKVFPLCTKCNSQPATSKHIIACIDSSIDELYSSPVDTIKSLKLYKLDTLI